MREQNGTVRKIGKNWFGAYSTWHFDNAKGRKARRQRTYRIGTLKEMTKVEARKALRIRVEAELGLREDSRKTLEWFIEFRWQPLREGSWRESTKKTNEEILSYIVAKFGRVPLERVESVALQVWLNAIAKGYSGSLTKHLRIFLRSIFAEAVEQDFIHKSPARLLKVPKLKKIEKPFLSVEEVKRLLANSGGADNVLLRLILVTGLRPSEIFALRWKSLDTENKLLNITESVYRGDIRDYTKTTDENSHRDLTIVFLPDSMVERLKALRVTTMFSKSDDYIFGTKSGHLWYKENWLRRNLEPIRKSAKIARVNFQILRRTVATLAQTLGTPRDIATMLRHKNVDTSQLHYVQARLNSVRLAADALANLYD